VELKEESEISMKNYFLKTIYGVSNRITARHFVKALHSYLVPIDYTRTQEIPVLLDESGIINKKNEKIRILDVGSPQILSLTLGVINTEWEIIYINPFIDEVDDLREKTTLLGIINIKTLQEDIKNIGLADKIGTFDYIFSCSVFEHIHPEDGGDKYASLNLKSLLNDGGICAISVPYYKKAFNEYKEKSVYFIENKGNEKIFFQRFYDARTIDENIISPSCLEVVSRCFIGERYYYPRSIEKRLGLYFSISKVRYVLGRFFSILSKIFMKYSNESTSLRKPYLAFIFLRKP